VDALFVEPAQHGRGTGALLMKAVEDAARCARSIAVRTGPAAWSN
jgi:GNAT superfamily N-acetyltransferase